MLFDKSVLCVYYIQCEVYETLTLQLSKLEQRNFKFVVVETRVISVLNIISSQ